MRRTRGARRWQHSDRTLTSANLQQPDKELAAKDAQRRGGAINVRIAAEGSMCCGGCGSRACLSRLSPVGDAQHAWLATPHPELLNLYTTFGPKIFNNSWVSGVPTEQVGIPDGQCVAETQFGLG